MRPISLRVQLMLVTASYVVVLAISGAMIFTRYMLYVNHAAEAAAAGGMYGFGDLMLEIIIGMMLLVPTLFLAVVIRNEERLYTGYSKVLLGLSLTAPICAGVLAIPAVSQSPMMLGEICLDRLLCTPVAVVGFAVSRIVARFDRAKRLTSYALGIEVLTIVVIIGTMVLAAINHK
jgi:hypothetical protein